VRRARQILEPLLQADCLQRGNIWAAMADTWGGKPARRPAHCAISYTATIEQIKRAPISAADRDSRVAGFAPRLGPRIDAFLREC